MTPAIAEAPALAAEDAARLRDYLSDETAAQDAVLQVLLRKEAYLVASDVPKLKGLLEGAEPLVAGLEDLARRRSRLLSTLGKKLRRDPEFLTLRAVVAATPSSERPATEAAALRLAAVLKDVARQNRRNNALTRSALETNRGLLHAILGAAPPTETYRRDGARVEIRSTAPRLSFEL